MLYTIVTNNIIITNNSNKTIEKIVVKICDQNGNCEEKTHEA